MAFEKPISAKENLKRFINGNPAWMPQYSDYKVFSPELFRENVARGFVAEDVPYTGERGGTDMFGIEWEYVPQVMGSMVRPGNPKVPDITEWENYIEWPDLSKLDWEGSRARNPHFFETDQILMQMVFTSFFERLISMVDMENALIAMIDPEEQLAVHRLFDRLADYYDELLGYFAEYYHPDLVMVHDDWGSQRAPLFSLETVEEMVVPYMKRVVDSAHRRGLVFELHSCGKIESLVPAMIECGVDMWCGQPMNDKEMICREYGNDIHIGVTPDEVAQDAPDEDLIREADRILETYPDSIYIGMHMIKNPVFTERIYEQTARV